MCCFKLQLYEIAPVLRYFPLPFYKAFQYFGGIKNHILKVVDEHKKSRVTGEPRDLIDSYLEEMEKVRHTISICLCYIYFYWIYQHNMSWIFFDLQWFISGSFCFQRADQGTTFDDSQMVTLLFDLFAAGTETTSNTLRTLTLYLMTHTHIQGKKYG